MQPKNNDSIPVFIVHWNRPQECLKTVKSFLEQDVSLKISIVDNASSWENFKLLQEKLPSNVDLIRLQENKGWGGGHNVLIRKWITQSKSSYCFLSAHDTLLKKDCLKMLLDSMDKNPDIGIICPEYGKAELPKYSPIKGPYIIPTTPRKKETVETVDFAHATLLLCRQQCLQDINLFDERHFAYGDEYDISLKAWKHNWKVAIVWGAVITNPGSWTPKPLLSYLLARNTLLLASTHGGFISAFIRSILMIFNTLRLSLLSFNSQNKTKFFPRAKFLGLRDFWIKRYGSPSVRFHN